jgi:hypothetical protein
METELVGESSTVPNSTFAGVAAAILTYTSPLAAVKVPWPW